MYLRGIETKRLLTNSNKPSIVANVPKRNRDQVNLDPFGACPLKVANVPKRNRDYLLSLSLEPQSDVANVPKRNRDSLLGTSPPKRYTVANVPKRNRDN